MEHIDIVPIWYKNSEIDNFNNQILNIIKFIDHGNIKNEN